MKYWDEVNGCVTDDKSYAPIYDGGSMYIETYQIGDTKLQIDIAYTEVTKQNENLYYFRKSQCEKHGITLNDLTRLVRLCVPTEKFNEVYADLEEYEG